MLKKVALFFLVGSLAVSAVASKAQGLLKDFLASLEEETKERVEQAKLDLESTAEVEKPDSSWRPSFVLHTTDGRIFQVGDLTFVAEPALDPLTALVESATFLPLSEKDYEVRFDFLDAPESKDLLASLLAGATNRLSHSEKYATGRFRIETLLGTSRTGEQWLLHLGKSRLQKLEVLR